MSFPFYETYIINQVSLIQETHDKVDGLSAMQWLNPCEVDCFSILESLLSRYPHYKFSKNIDLPSCTFIYQV